MKCSVNRGIVASLVVIHCLFLSAYCDLSPSHHLPERMTNGTKSLMAPSRTNVVLVCLETRMEQHMILTELLSLITAESHGFRVEDSERK